ncbi:hypothetical protein PAI11_41530 [Patulibacter medicamentivorans]|uniref:DUF2784 domain-containing protein n=1 Tax=Patulibacter medicamentivorans TaxID=1097667 RepID=H0EBC4_9ACTN|nr:hypothetical protein [Patulibacter medicamentivorans]EHN09000.1 hypothetical protein PAI11_41530 [Patulibacter medicamentivorans]
MRRPARKRDPPSTAIIDDVAESDLSHGARAFRVVHALITAGFLVAIVDVWWSALTRRRGRGLRVAVAALAAEGALVTANGGDCPLGGLQERLGDPVPLFQLVLSPTAARRAVPVLGAIATIGIALLARRPPGPRATPRPAGAPPPRPPAA